MIGFLARALLCSAFLVSGVAKAADFPAAAAEVAALTGMAGASAPIAALVILVQLGGSALVLAGGRWAVGGAALLGGFTIAATLVAHAFWAKTGGEAARDLATFFEHAGLVGGFLLVARAGAGAART